MTTLSDTATQPNADTAAARRAMIHSQLRTSGVNEEFALARMMAVPREAFLPADRASLAYIDRSIPLADGGHLAAPLFYGKILLEADPSSDDRVLIVEGGTGYLAELLRPLVGAIDTVSAKDAAKGQLPAGKTYSLVLVDGAIEQLPQSLCDAVEEGGRIAGGLLLRQVTRLAAGRKVAGQVGFLPVEDLGIPVLHAFDTPKGWSF
jgi:protein-L-isoaspartate(D-aspartate) O-methyltransferase